MNTVTVDEILRDVGGYLQQVKAGKTFLVIDSDQPAAEIRPVIQKSAGPRPYALRAGEFWVIDDFGTPSPEEIIARFEGP
jgi:antitoxin (DNA-binding transcriptional repressor) of toxin-antitoxin stability system